MTSYEAARDAVVAALAPVAAYCARTARPNRHAEQLDALVGAVAGFGMAAEAALVPAPPPAPTPDWERLCGMQTRRLMALDPGPTDPFIARIERHLAVVDRHRPPCPLLTDDEQAAEYRRLATITSHHLGIPASL